MVKIKFSKKTLIKLKIQRYVVKIVKIKVDQKIIRFKSIDRNVEIKI